MLSATTDHGYTPGGGEAWRDPWPSYAWLRDHDPLHHVVPQHAPDEDFYVLSRHADVHAAAVDAATFSSSNGLTVSYGELERIGLADSPPLVMQDPPGHTALRRLVARGFTPRQVKDVEPAVRAFVAERLDRLAAAGGGDIVAELFKPLPSMVVAHYLGVPAEDRGRFDGWTDAIVAASASGEGLEAAMTGAADAIAEMLDYFTVLLGDGEIAQQAGLVPMLGYVFTMVTGGNDTTTGLLGGAVQLLASDPDQWAALVGDPALIPDAIEELLRLTSPVQALARTATRDVVLHDVVVPAGRKVLLLYGAANRDPRKYGDDADQLDLRRRPTQIMSFGQGHHHCLGAAAARLQSRVALEELLARVPDFDVDHTAVRWAEGPYVRRPVTVPFTVGRTT